MADMKLAWLTATNSGAGAQVSLREKRSNPERPACGPGLLRISRNDGSGYAHRHMGQTPLPVTPHKSHIKLCGSTTACTCTLPAGLGGPAPATPAKIVAGRWLWGPDQQAETVPSTGRLCLRPAGASHAARRPKMARSGCPDAGRHAVLRAPAGFFPLDGGERPGHARSLSLDRFRLPVVKAMLPLRMPRRA